MKFGYSQEDITPARGIPLCGYFEPRPNRGAYDRLMVKAALFQSNGVTTGIISYDLCLFGRSLVNRFQEALLKAGIPFAKELLFSATHTHTGPYVSSVCGDDCTNASYIDDLVAKTVRAVQGAFANLSDAELLTGKSSCANLAFNRRFWMKDGTVLTNPGKLNPNIVKPEGGIDPEIPLLAVRQDGMLRLIVANISNHTDTVGGDIVTADWPGRMEKEIQHSIGYDLPVITLLACQGNINHFNVENNVNQTCYAEACRIGKGYAAAILSEIYALKSVPEVSISVVQKEFEAPAVQITDQEYLEAKAIVEQYSNVKATSADDLTSEGIAKGNTYVKCHFAKQVMDCRDNPLKEKRIENMLAIRFADTLGIVGIPAEPFIEIQLAIKAASPFPLTMVGALCMGSIGYIGLPESYGRGGGYETRPSPTAPAHDLAPKVVETANSLLAK